MIINKPFRFLKNIMRFYEREAKNIYKEIRQLEISEEMWKKAEYNFNKRGLSIPIYENHDEDSVVGSVYKIEARNDGLYVVEHYLNDRGLKLVKDNLYPLPSGDFVLHYDQNDNLIDLEVFAVSLVNNEGAKDVEVVTMSKSFCKISKLNKSKSKKEEKKMDREIILEHLLDYNFLSELPYDVIKAIAEVKGKEIKAMVEDMCGSKEEGESLEDNDDYDTLSEDEKLNEKSEKQKKVFMSKLHDAIAKKSYDDKLMVLPSSLKVAERFISKNYRSIDSNKLIDMAVRMCNFYGNGKTENVMMRKEVKSKMTPDEILLAMAKK